VHRPFGDAYVDGLDFFLERGPPEYYDVLAARLWSYNKQFRARTPVQLSATPRCAFPDRRVQKVLATGLVTRINVRFYGDGHCAAYWQQEWDKWTAAFPDSGIYVGLPASEQTVGYVHPKNLYYGVVPVVQKAANYGGIMIWDRYADKQTNYSSYAIQWA
jgi:chitinase